MNDQISILLICGGGFLVVVLIVWLGVMAKKIRCPKCGHRTGKEIGAEKIPGTEERIRESTPTQGVYKSVLYAKYRVVYECQDCGHRWKKVRMRPVPGAEVDWE